MESEMLQGKCVILGVSGGIAAYKAAELLRLLVKAGAEVHVVMTRSAQEFITPLTLQTLSGNPVHPAFTYQQKGRLCTPQDGAFMCSLSVLHLRRVKC